MGYRIDILCTDGSPLGVTLSTIYGDKFQKGVGGAELALMTMFQHWSMSHDVRLYNSPRVEASQQFPISAFNPDEDRDILIVFRSPNEKAINAKGKKIWWSMDQVTIGDFKDFSQYMDEIVLISPNHKTYFETRYGITQTRTIDLPVRSIDYYVDRHSDITRKPNQLLYCSQPDRGLDLLADYWPEIKERVPEAELVVTSGRKLWGASVSGNEKQKVKFLGSRGVNFLSEVPREELVKLQLESGVLVFPCIYDELFCITVAEALYAGMWPVTSNVGALQTTNFNEDYRIDMHPADPRFRNEFIGRIAKAVDHEEAERYAQVDMAMERYSPTTVAQQWDEVFK